MFLGWMLLGFAIFIPMTSEGFHSPFALLIVVSLSGFIAFSVFVLVRLIRMSNDDRVGLPAVICGTLPIAYLLYEACLLFSY